MSNCCIENLLELDYNMRNNIDQPLAACQLNLDGYRPRFVAHEAVTNYKQIEGEDEEFIDVIGDDHPESIVDKVASQKSLLEHPPSKIYYDNIEKESSDGGFFDRDDLEDEDERNDLVIDCKLVGEQPEPKKTEPKKTLRINARRHSIAETPLTTIVIPSSPESEPEVVLNFTLVDTQLVYNESNFARKLPTHENLQQRRPPAAAATVSVPPAPRRRGRPPNPRPAPLPPQQQQQQSNSVVQHNNLKEIRALKEMRFRPYSKLMPNDPRRHARAYREVVNSRRVLPPPPPLPSPGPSLAEPIGSRHRSSAFKPPVKSQLIRQSVPVPASFGHSPPISYSLASTAPKLPKRAYHRNPYPEPPQRYSKLLRQINKQQHQLVDACPPPPPPQPVPKPVTYLPLQFGFGYSVLQNLYDDQHPLDFSKNSPLSQYDRMLKQPPEKQIRFGFQILRSMPVPPPLEPPERAIRPQVVPMKYHPTLSQLRRPLVQRREPQPPPPPPKQAIPRLMAELLKSKPLPKKADPAPQEPPPPPKSTEAFTALMRRHIDALFSRRQEEICATLRLFSDGAIDMRELFNQLKHLEIRDSRDYPALAWSMVQRSGCRYRPGVPPFRMDYRWPERPQQFIEYFRSLGDALQPNATEATLDIYRIVVGGLLEQFRASMEHFLSRNLATPPSMPQ